MMTRAKGIFLITSVIMVRVFVNSSWFGRARRQWDTMEHQQGGNVRVRSEIAWLAGTVEVAAPAGSGLVDTAASCVRDVQAAAVFERQDRAVIKEHSSMAGTARSLAVDARQDYHKRRTNSATVVVW